MAWKQLGWKLVIAAAVVLAALFWVMWGMSSAKEISNLEPEHPEEAVYTLAPDVQQESLEPQPEEEPTGQQEVALEEEVVPIYDFTQPAPETEPVEKSYFEDAAFVGDSRTDGFMIYSGIGCGTNLTSNGLSIFQLAEKKALTIGGEKFTLLEALAQKEYGKVYLSLGVNELGVFDDEGFYQSYLAAIDAIRAIQPNAILYIQGLIPLNEADIAASGGKDYLKNDRLRVYDSLMRKAAEEKQVVFLDLYTAFADENGSLPSGASRDGVHLKKEYCQKWLEYIQHHTVPREALGLTEKEENPQI